MWKCLYIRANESFIHSLTRSVAQSLISAVRLLAWSIVCARNVKISRANKTNCMAEEKWRARAGVMQKKENYYVSNEYYVLSILGSAILLSHIQTLIRMESSSSSINFATHLYCSTLINVQCVCVCRNEGTRWKKITPTNLSRYVLSARVNFSSSFSLCSSI